MKKNGFTLIECLIVVAIFGLILALTIPGVITEQKANRLVEQINTAKTKIADDRSLKPGDTIDYDDLSLELPDGFFYNEEKNVITYSDFYVIRIGNVGEPAKKVKETP